MADSFAVVTEMRQAIHWYYSDLSIEADVVSTIRALHGYHNLLNAFVEWEKKEGYYVTTV